ncbi:ABC transporter ATP-binding protein [Streptococcus macacae]|uniref:ABC transporter, ATP-binding protein n=1 Tax=Streptococcus macacae NCTC 11558 TaxID=764298 RepID=G5JXM7_9STRE|nr:ATP-binding cassette domain-containing protein [Streptococcus macacae]EHJ52369.1 ABC transporter, ATP-binding protein [Streptococcus macacae NCTC 11558]SUN77585.1 bhtF [Streptococcus macacae NCTC 11558]
MSVLEVKQLHFQFGKQTVLDNVSFALDKGDIAGLIGDNGAGKTTLMKIISGILPGAVGKCDLYTDSVGALIEEPALYPYLSVQENLKFYCKLYGKDYAIIDQFKEALDVTVYLNRKASKLSLGMRQRVGLFIALIASNEFILLDEPTNGLDPKGINSLLNLINKLAKQYGITFIISSHILANLDQVCNKNFLLRHHQLTCLDDEAHAKYKIYSEDRSLKDLIAILTRYGITFERKNHTIVVNDLQAVKDKLTKEGIVIQYEKAGLSEVFFDEN